MSFKGRNNNRRPSYFKDGVQRFGEDFLDRKTAFELEKDSYRIIKDIVFGNIDFESELQFISHPAVVQACLGTAYKEYITANYNYVGNTMLIQSGTVTDPYLESVMQYNMRRKDAYSLIWNAFNSFRETGNPSWLDAVRNQVAKYKSNI